MHFFICLMLGFVFCPAHCGSLCRSQMCSKGCAWLELSVASGLSANSKVWGSNSEATLDARGSRLLRGVLEDIASAFHWGISPWCHPGHPCDERLFHGIGDMLCIPHFLSPSSRSRRSTPHIPHTARRTVSNAWCLPTAWQSGSWNRTGIVTWLRSKTRSAEPATASGTALSTDGRVPSAAQPRGMEKLTTHVGRLRPGRTSWPAAAMRPHGLRRWPAGLQATARP